MSAGGSGRRSLLSAGALALIGAAAGAVCLALAFLADPDFSLEMDRELPRFVSAFHDIELAQDVSFAWTKRRAAVTLNGLDRRTPWVCSVRFRGARAAPLPQPQVSLGVDGVTIAARPATNVYQNVDVVLPPRPARAGAVLEITSDPAFVPGPADTRELGVQVDRLTCRPQGWALPPQRALVAAAIGGAAFGSAFALLGFGVVTAGLLTLGVAIAQALPLSSGPAPYASYQDSARMLAIWIAVLMVLTVIALERLRRQPLDGAARAVVACSGALMFLELLALLHPSKGLVDAVFHAHRLQWVLDGRYFFTQPMPDGVRFPYAIGLYVFAAPWSALTKDFVTLLRVVVMAWHAAAGALLFVMVVRVWGDRVAGLLAVLLFHLVPLPFIVIGNANLTYAFGQSAAFVTLAAAVVLPLGGERNRSAAQRPAATGTLDGRKPGFLRQVSGAASDLGRERRRISRTSTWVQFAALFLVASLAMLSHVGVFPVLLTTLLALAVAAWLFGGPTLRAPARFLALAAVLAAVFAVGIYYGHFREVYATLSRVTGRDAGSTATGRDGGPTTTGRDTGPTQTGRVAGPTATSAGLIRRVVNAGGLGVRATGWPAAVLMIVGLAVVWRGGARDRLTLALAAGLATYALFVLTSVAVPVEPRFQRYTDEFIDRVNYATLPTVVMLAAHAAAAGWRFGLATRLAAVAMLAAAGTYGVRAWLAWFS